MPPGCASGLCLFGSAKEKARISLGVDAGPLEFCPQTLVVAFVAPRRSLRRSFALLEPYSGVAAERKHGNITTAINMRAISASCIRASTFCSEP